MRAQIAKDGAKDAQRIDARVMPEADVFRHDDRVLQVLRDLIERDRPPVLELIAQDRRQKLRFERSLVDRPAVANGAEGSDRTAIEFDSDGLRFIQAGRMRELTRVDVKLTAFCRVVATLRNRMDLTVSKAVEFFEDVIRGNDRPRPQRSVISVDARGQRDAAHLEFSDRLLVHVDREKGGRHENDDDDDRDNLKNRTARGHYCPTIARLRPLFSSRRYE